MAWSRVVSWKGRCWRVAASLFFQSIGFKPRLYRLNLTSKQSHECMQMAHVVWWVWWSPNIQDPPRKPCRPYNYSVRLPTVVGGDAPAGRIASVAPCAPARNISLIWHPAKSRVVAPAKDGTWCLESAEGNVGCLACLVSGFLSIWRAVFVLGLGISTRWHSILGPFLFTHVISVPTTNCHMGQSEKIFSSHHTICCSCVLSAQPGLHFNRMM